MFDFGDLGVIYIAVQPILVFPSHRMIAEKNEYLPDSVYHTYNQFKSREIFSHTKTQVSKHHFYTYSEVGSGNGVRCPVMHVMFDQAQP